MPGCHSCGRDLNAASDYGRQDTCEGCGRATRVCLNCMNYDTSKYNECLEPVADRVVDKEKSNFCDYFKAGNRAAAGDAARKAREAAEALFRKKP